MEITFTKIGHITRKSALALAERGLKWCPQCHLPKSMSEFTKSRRLCKTHIAEIDQRSRQARAEYQRTHREQFVGYARKSQGGNGRFATSRATAKRNGRTWQLTRDEYTNLISQHCEYCHLELNSHGIGLDRLDNSIGYQVDNVVPCCVPCNTARMDNFTPDEMRQYIGPAIRTTKLARATK